MVDGRVFRILKYYIYKIIRGVEWTDNTLWSYLIAQKKYQLNYCIPSKSSDLNSNVVTRCTRQHVNRSKIGLIIV